VRDFPRGDAVEVEIPLYEASGERRWLEFADDFEDDHLARDIAAVPLPKPAERWDGVVACFSAASAVPPRVALDPGDAVRVIGCPRGVFDRLHNIPVVRNGVAATPNYVPYEGHPCFLVDAQLHPGISGSPVTSAPGIWKEECGADVSMTSAPTPAVFLLGVLSADTRGTGLGVVWDARLIRELTGGQH